MCENKQNNYLSSVQIYFLLMIKLHVYQTIIVRKYLVCVLVLYIYSSRSYKNFSGQKESWAYKVLRSPMPGKHSVIELPSVPNVCWRGGVCIGACEHAMVVYACVVHVCGSRRSWLYSFLYCRSTGSFLKAIDISTQEAEASLWIWGQSGLVGFRATKALGDQHGSDSSSIRVTGTLPMLSFMWV